MEEDKKQQPANRLHTHDLIREVSKHTRQPYHIVADVIYGFLAGAKYMASENELRMPVWGAGHFRRTIYKARNYATKKLKLRRPDRLKITFNYDPNILEIDRWKSMQSLRQKTIAALPAAPKLVSMDLCVAAQIAGLSLSSRQLIHLEGKEKLQFVRGWIKALATSPLLPAKTRTGSYSLGDYKDVEFKKFQFRIAGRERSAVVLEKDLDDVRAQFCTDGPEDIIFFPTAWGVPISRNGTMVRIPYGDTIEQQCVSLFQAYIAVKYGKQKIIQARKAGKLTEESEE